MNPNVEKAKALPAALGGYIANKVIDALDEAGLIVTPLHARALAACEAYSKVFHSAFVYSPESATCIEIGRESLESKRPKVRYVVVDGNVGSFIGLADMQLPVMLTHEQAQVVADALNAMEAK